MESLHTRMRALVCKQNNDRWHYFKPHIVTLKSKQILKYINSVISIEDKLKVLDFFNQIAINVSNKLEKRFNPTVIYTFHDEIHLVFFYNDNGDSLYNGNKNRILTTITSFASVEMTKELLKNHVDISFEYNGKLIEFHKDYETLNYLIYRQVDCKRNTILLLYKCYKNIASSDIKSNKMFADLCTVYDKEFLTKYLQGIIMKNGKVTHMDLSVDFSETFSKLINVC